MGRLVRDPEIRYSQGEKSTAVAKYTLAVDRKFKKEGGQGADFINCVAFGKSAQFAEYYLHQGMKICVVGSWQTGNYTNKNGQKMYTNDCNVMEHYFCESKGGENVNSVQNRHPEPQPMTGSDGFMEIPDGVDEGLPFS